MVRTQTCGHCELQSFRLSDAAGDQIGGPEGCEMTKASASSTRRGNSAPLFGGDDESVAGDPRYVVKPTPPSTAPGLKSTDFGVGYVWRPCR